jgi:hypothetical protein
VLGFNFQFYVKVAWVQDEKMAAFESEYNFRLSISVTVKEIICSTVDNFYKLILIPCFVFCKSLALVFLTKKNYLLYFNLTYYVC